VVRHRKVDSNEASIDHLQDRFGTATRRLHEKHGLGKNGLAGQERVAQRGPARDRPLVVTVVAVQIGDEGASVQENASRGHSRRAAASTDREAR
jgi:hypothetical protein